MAGSASSLAISSQFALGCLSSYLVSLLQDDTPYAMTLIMFLFALISFSHQFLIPKKSSDSELAPKALVMEIKSTTNMTRVTKLLSLKINKPMPEAS